MIKNMGISICMCHCTVERMLVCNCDVTVYAKRVSTHEKFIKSYHRTIEGMSMRYEFSL